MCSSEGTFVRTEDTDGHTHDLPIVDNTGNFAYLRISSSQFVIETSDSLFVNGLDTNETNPSPSQHYHDVSLPNHTHGITYGIHEEATSPTINVYCDNGSGYGSSIGAYTSTQTDLNITSNFSGAGWKNLKFTSNVRCRISCVLLVKIDINA